MKVLVTGANGQIGSEIIKIFSTTEHEVIAFTRRDLDCTHLQEVYSILSAVHADMIINATGYTAVDKAEDEPHLADLVNAQFVAQLASYCEQSQIPLIHLSTDYVFDGTKAAPYNETDLPNPVNVYGQSKLAGEQAIITQLKKHIILRISWIFGVTGTNFVKTILKLASSKNELKIVADQWGKPTASGDIARVILNIVEQINDPLFEHWGIYHYASNNITNWYEFSRVFVAQAQQIQSTLASSCVISPIQSHEYPTKANRPKNSVLDTQKIEQVLGIKCHCWSDYLPEVINCVG